MNDTCRKSKMLSPVGLRKTLKSTPGVETYMKVIRNFKYDTVVKSGIRH